MPLSDRAKEIVAERISLQPESDYIFTSDGKPIDSHYRKLKQVCKDLGIVYGRHKDGGFIMHDLRRNFGTDIAKNSDIETVRKLLGLKDIKTAAIYLATNNEKLSEAVSKLNENSHLHSKFVIIEELIKTGELDEKNVIKSLQKIIENSD